MKNKTADLLFMEIQNVSKKYKKKQEILLRRLKLIFLINLIYLSSCINR